MKILQDYLKEADKEQLIDEYMINHPLTFRDLMDSDKSVKEIVLHMRQTLSSFIDHLCSITPNVDLKAVPTLIVLPVYDNWFADEDTTLVHLSDGMDGDRYTTYAYEFCPHEEIVGFFVAETELTRHNLSQVMYDAIFEASFFGFDEGQKAKEEAEELDRRAKDAKEHPERLIPFDSVKKEWEEEFGLWFRPRDEHEISMHDEMLRIGGELNRYLLNMEVEKAKSAAKDLLADFS